MPRRSSSRRVCRRLSRRRAAWAWSRSVRGHRSRADSGASRRRTYRAATRSSCSEMGITPSRRCSSSSTARGSRSRSRRTSSGAMRSVGGSPMHSWLRRRAVSACACSSTGSGGWAPRARSSRRMRPRGVDVSIFNPPSLTRRWLGLVPRDHRKLLVVDGAAGVTGGHRHWQRVAHGRAQAASVAVAGHGGAH